MAMVAIGAQEGSSSVNVVVALALAGGKKPFYRDCPFITGPADGANAGGAGKKSGSSSVKMSAYG